MFSSLKLSNLRGRKMVEGEVPLPPGPPHLDLTSPPAKKPPHPPVVTTNRRSHKWSIDKALCPGIGEKKVEEKTKIPLSVETSQIKQENVHNNNCSPSDDWDSKSLECTDDEHSSHVQVVTRTMHVSIERDAGGSLGITLRGGAHPDPAMSRPLIITQIKPGGPADREGTIKVGDRLLSVDGHPLNGVTLTEAQNKLRATASPLSLLCVQYDVSVMSRVRAAQGPLLVEIDGPQCNNLGLELVNTPDNSAVVIGHVKTGSIAERCGALMPGDQILAVNDICVEDTKMTAEDVNQLLWTGNSCVLQILPSSSSSYRSYPQPLYSCPSPSQSSKHSREVYYINNPPSKTQSPMMKRLQSSSPSIHDSEVEANSSGVYQRKSLTVSLNCDAHSRFGITLAPDSKMDVCICAVEPRSPAERCGSLQVGDRVVAINSNPPPHLTSPQLLENLTPGTSVNLTIEFAVAQTVMPTSGVFTVKLANNKLAGLGITISGCSHYRGWMVISHIRLGSVAHRCGTLGPGDRILSVNNHSLVDCSLEQAIEILHSTQDIVTLVVQKLSDESREEGESYGSIHTVEFCREGGPLGITIAGSEDPLEPIVISALTPGGLAEQSQALQIGDQLLAIDSRSLSHEPLSTAIFLLQNSKDRVILCVGRSNPTINSNLAREDLMGYSSPEIPSVDSAVESWDSLHEQSPPAAQPNHNQHMYKSESATVRRKQPLQSCDSPILTCNTDWSSAGLHSTNSLNTVQSDADTFSSFKLSEAVLNDYTSQLIAQQKCAPPSPPCPLQVNYQHRNNTLPTHRRCSSIGVMKYHESIQANLVSSPRRCRKGFHLLDDEASNFPLSEDIEITHPEVTFDTFFKRVPGVSRDTPEHSAKTDRHIFQVTLYKDPVYEDFGFSVSDGLYERGVFINRIRRGGPADTSRVLQPYDRILQVNETKTEDLDCCMTVPLVASAGDKLQLTVSRSHYSHHCEIKDYDMSTLPWVDDDKDSQTLVPTKPPTITKTL